ncbi:MAG: hypothetical protein ACREFY_00765, partial [Acetobacteraceae bacterium]
MTPKRHPGKPSGQPGLRAREEIELVKEYPLEMVIRAGDPDSSRASFHELSVRVQPQHPISVPVRDLLSIRRRNRQRIEEFPPR